MDYLHSHPNTVYNSILPAWLMLLLLIKYMGFGAFQQSFKAFHYMEHPQQSQHESGFVMKQPDPRVRSVHEKQQQQSRNQDKEKYAGQQ